MISRLTVSSNTPFSKRFHAMYGSIVSQMMFLPILVLILGGTLLLYGLLSWPDTIDFVRWAMMIGRESSALESMFLVFTALPSGVILHYFIDLGSHGNDIVGPPAQLELNFLHILHLYILCTGIFGVFSWMFFGMINSLDQGCPFAISVVYLCSRSASSCFLLVSTLSMSLHKTVSQLIKPITYITFIVGMAINAYTLSSFPSHITDFSQSWEWFNVIVVHLASLVLVIGESRMDILSKGWIQLIHGLSTLHLVIQMALFPRYALINFNFLGVALSVNGVQLIILALICACYLMFVRANNPHFFGGERLQRLAITKGSTSRSSQDERSASPSNINLTKRKQLSDPFQTSPEFKSNSINLDDQIQHDTVMTIGHDEHHSDGSTASNSTTTSTTSQNVLETLDGDLLQPFEVPANSGSKIFHASLNNANPHNAALPTALFWFLSLSLWLYFVIAKRDKLFSMAAIFVEGDPFEFE